MHIFLRVSTCLALFFLTSKNLAEASDSKLSFRPYAELGIMDYEFSFDDVVLANGSVGDGFTVNDTLFMGGIGITSSYKRFYLDIAARATTEGSDTGQIFLTDLVGGLPVAGTHDYRIKFDRKEIDASVGYKLSNIPGADVHIYLGYRYAQTEFENRTSTVDPVLIGGDLLAPGEGVFDGVFDIDFTYHGPFAGLSVGVPFPIIGGTLIATPSVGYFFGNFDQNFDPDVGARVPVIDNADADGNSLGFNVGLTYAQKIGENISASLGIDRSQFNFETSSDDAEADFEEVFNRLRIKFQYKF